MSRIVKDGEHFLLLDSIGFQPEPSTLFGTLVLQVLLLYRVQSFSTSKSEGKREEREDTIPKIRKCVEPGTPLKTVRTYGSTSGYV